MISAGSTMNGHSKMKCAAVWSNALHSQIDVKASLISA